MEVLWLVEAPNKYKNKELLPLIDFRLGQIADEYGRKNRPAEEQAARDFLAIEPEEYASKASEICDLYQILSRKDRKEKILPIVLAIYLKISSITGMAWREVAAISDDDFKKLQKKLEKNGASKKHLNKYMDAPGWLNTLLEFHAPAGLSARIKYMREILPGLNSPGFQVLEAMAYYHETRRIRPEDRARLLVSEDKNIRMLAMDVLARKKQAEIKKAGASGPSR